MPRNLPLRDNMISKEDVKHIANLARIELNEKETERFQKDISSFLDYFNMLKDVDTEKVKPTFHSSESYFKGNVAREDKAEESSVADKIISLFPDEKNRCVKVKPVFK